MLNGKPAISQELREKVAIAFWTCGHAEGICFDCVLNLLDTAIKEARCVNELSSTK